MTMLKITKHELSGAHLHLDMRKETMITLNADHIISYSYDKDFPNGYGDKLPYMEIEVSNGTSVELYREDAVAALMKLEGWKDDITELEKENKRLNVELSNVIEVFQSSSSGDDLEMAECAREIMEILGISCYRHGKVKSRLSEAKEILRELLLAEDENYCCDAEHDMKHIDVRRKAKAFLGGEAKK